MKISFLTLQYTILITLFLAFACSDAQAAAELTIYRASINGPNPVVSYADLSYQYGIRNTGDEKSSQFTHTVYLSEDEDFTEDDYELHVGNNRMGLDPNEIRTYGRFFDIPADFSNGDYYIGVVLELSDGTHVTTRTAGAVTVARPTDLRVGIVSVDTAASSGEQLVVLVVIYNDGMGVSDSFTLDCYIDQYLIGSDTFGLDPDENTLCTVYCDIPDDLPDDDYYIRAVVSCEYDGNSGNNEGESDSTWVGSPIDLAVQSVQIAPGAYLPGEDFVIYSLIENIGGRDSKSYTVDYYASTDATITTDDHHIGHVERGELAPGEQHSYDTTYQIPFNIVPGSYYIGIIITCRDEYDPTNNVGRDDASVQLVHPAGYVCGQMLYQARDRGKVFPIRYALVEVYDADDNEDPLDDRVIGKTHTDPNGNYGVTVLNDETSSQNIYVKVFTESPIGAYPDTINKAGIVKDDVFDEIYYLKSDLYPHPQNLSVVVNMTAHKDSGEFMVYDSIIESFRKAKTFFDVNLPEITTFWPGKYGMSYFDPCDLGIYISHEDRGDRDVIMHEYGHYIADVFAFAQGDVGDNSIHYWDADLRYNPDDRSNEEARNLTFRESWATLFSVATQYGDNWYSFSGDTLYYDFDENSGYSLIIDLEKDTANYCEPGEYYEHMNCCALWDIFDDNDDDVDDDDTLKDITLSKIWSVMRDSQPDDIIDFWNGWFQSYDYTSDITRIFNDHGMSFKKPED